MKRFLDVLLSLLAIIFLSPLMLIISLIIICDDGLPVIFRQNRVGKGDELFKIKKFRTMKNGAPNLSTADFEQSDEFITRSGKFLRRTSLDELPQLFNVLTGDMSFIGPRPLLVSYLPYYTETEALRHTVRPGLTGLAQVSGRNFLDWDRRLAKDVEYVKGLSFQMDLKVLFLTVKVVFDRSDVAEDTSQAEGNFARIRQERLDRTGRLEA